MCGIVGYVGKKQQAKDFILQGLETLEYRGYDSAGMALINNGAHLFKEAGRVEALNKVSQKDPAAMSSHMGIGHTRWATHGKPTTKNAHPHFNKDRSIFVVHNGIIENYQEIKDKLIKEGYVFKSDTDTEVIPHLIDYHLTNASSFEQAFKYALHELRGAYAIAVVTTHNPDTLYVAKLSSPIVIGIAPDAHYLASDASALMHKTKKVTYLDDFEIAILQKDNLKIHNFKNQKDVKRDHELLSHDAEIAELGDYKHFMHKEIHEAPQTIQSAIRGRINPESNQVKLGGLEAVQEQLRFIDRIVIVACGTSYFAGLVGEYLIEEIAGIPVEVQLASEFKYRNEPFSRSTALLAISQSGETADTIAAIKKVENYGVLTLGIVNAVGSTIARMTDAGVYCHAGPEKSVASTKAFIAQVTILAEIALHLSDGKAPNYNELLTELTNLPNKAKQILSTEDNIQKIAKKYATCSDFLYIGRGYNAPSALEGALKLKEVSYIHAEGYAAGEMKHGPLALIDENFPTFAIATNSNLLEKTISSIQEIRARGGPIIAISTKGNKNVASHVDEEIKIPDTLEQYQPILVAIAMQLFAYYVACSKKLDVDKPRNLAKSVTVE